MSYKLKYPLSAEAGKALLENNEQINDWALKYMDYLAENRSRITGFVPTILRADVEEASQIVKRNREEVSKDK